MFNAKETGKRIRDRRMSLKLSLREFAEILGLSTSFIRLIENGERFVTADKLIKISNVLGVSTDYILTGKGELPELDVAHERRRYLLEIIKSTEEVDFHIELALILKHYNCGPRNYKNICGVINAFASYAEDREQTPVLN